MHGIRVAAAGVFGLLAACGSGGKEGEGSEGAAVVAVEQGPHAHAVTRRFGIEMGKLNVEEATYVDGLAMRFEGGAGALLTEAPLSACAKLAIVAHGSVFDASALGDKPALLLLRDEEYPQGAILRIEPYSRSTLEDSFPALVTEGDTLIASGDVGDAGWGNIDATKYGGENAPHVRLDVKLPYATLADADAVSADASAEAAWLRELQVKAAADAEATAAASVEVDPEDYRSGMMSSSWFDVLANWSDFSVVALARDDGCATMLLREPGFAGGYREAIVQLRVAGDTRKATAVETESMDSVEGNYVVGRVEHPTLGAFPVLHARAAREEGLGLVVYFSDQPIALEPFEALVAKQRMLRAVSAFESGNQYSFSTYDLGGPGFPVEQIDAGNSTTNPYLEEGQVAGLIKLGEGEGPRIVVNFRQPLAR